MRQHQDAPTTEDIAAVDERHATEESGGDVERIEPDAVDSDRSDADRVESERVGSEHAESERVGSGHADADRFDADRAEGDGLDAGRVRTGRAESGGVASDRVTVDETARPADTTLAGQTEPHGRDESAADVLMDDADAERFRVRWHEVQAAFVDDPKRAVQDADVLVAELMQHLASAFGERKRLLEDKWRAGTDAETEDLRLALRGYRSFLDQLLAH